MVIREVAHKTTKGDLPNGAEAVDLVLENARDEILRGLLMATVRKIIFLD